MHSSSIAMAIASRASGDSGVQMDGDLRVFSDRLTSIEASIWRRRANEHGMRNAHLRSHSSFSDGQGLWPDQAGIGTGLWLHFVWWTAC